ncbi:MAG: sugar kinase [Spirochaetaceae bacterium]|jgi:sugar (pentulose or hexulose) kinase|nr:sugar kinase [Spirochaetaceae bacterium]
MGKTRKRNAILCADIGTTSLKAALIDIGAAGGKRLLGFSRETYQADGGAAGTPELWEAAFYRAVKVLSEFASEARIEAVCISGNGPTLVPLEGDALAGRALPPLHWFSPRLAAPDGGVSAASFFLPIAAWFRRNEPENYAKTSLFLSCQEWLSARLGAAPVTVLPTPRYRPYYYDDDQFAAFALDGRKFPPFAPLGALTGRVSGEAARLCGLKAGLPIVGGGPDFIMALLGSGAVEPGFVCDRAGSSEGINVCAREPPPVGVAAAHSLRVLPHAVDGLWNVSVVLPESGSIFDHYRLENGLQDVPYEEMLKSMAGEGRPPHPVLRRIADGTKGALETLRKAGYPVYEMRHSGGQAKSPLWNRLKAEICGCRLLVPEIVDTELAGNAAAAMFALGYAPSVPAACQKIVVTGRQASLHQTYANS